MPSFHILYFIIFSTLGTRPNKLVAGHLCTQHDLYYMVLSLPDSVTGKKKPVWFPTGLKVKGNKTQANKMLQKARREATKGILPPRPKAGKSDQDYLPVVAAGDLRSSMLFSQYILYWLQANRTTWEETDLRCLLWSNCTRHSALL